MQDSKVECLLGWMHITVLLSNFLCKRSLFNSEEDMAMKRKLWQELDDQQAEKVSGGMNKGELVDKVADKAAVKQLGLDSTNGNFRVMFDFFR